MAGAAVAKLVAFHVVAVAHASGLLAAQRGDAQAFGETSFWKPGNIMRCPRCGYKLSPFEDECPAAGD